MKTLILILASTIISFAQIQFNQSITGFVNLVRLEKGDYWEWQKNNKIYLKGLDSPTISKTIDIPTITGFVIQNVYNISSKLFNSDTLLEFIVAYYGSGVFNSKLYNENGVVLNSFDNVYAPAVYWLPSGTKLVINGLAETQIYTFTNTPINEQYPEMTPQVINNKYYYYTTISGVVTVTSVITVSGNTTRIESGLRLEDGNVYPNPSSGIININYAITNDATLSIVNIEGKHMFDVQLSPNNRSVVIDMSNASKGLYNYYILEKGKKEKIDDKQFILN